MSQEPKTWKILATIQAFFFLKTLSNISTDDVFFEENVSYEFIPHVYISGFPLTNSQNELNFSLFWLLRGPGGTT